MLEHVLIGCADVRMLVVATFRTTEPDRSDELVTRLAELHRFDGVRRLDLAGLDTEAIAEFVRRTQQLTPASARTAAALLRDKTGGNPFFLTELCNDLEIRGGIATLSAQQTVPASIGDAIARRLGGLGPGVREVIEQAAVLGETFDLPALIATSETDLAATLAAIDSAEALGLIRRGPRLRRRILVRARADPRGRRRRDGGVAAADHARARRRSARGPRGPIGRSPPGQPLPAGARAGLPRAGVAIRASGGPDGRTEPGLRGRGEMVRAGGVASRAEPRGSGKDEPRCGREPRARR